jgi:hypothetical protein
MAELSQIESDTGGGKRRIRRGECVTYLALAVCVGLLFLFSMRGVLFSDDPKRHAGSGDTHAYIGPVQFFLDTSLSRGDLPLWNPHTYSGTPFAAHPLSMVFYPPNLVRSLLTGAGTPRDTLLSLYAMGLFHQLVLVLGLYALARLEKLRVSTSCVIALSLGFSGWWLQSSVRNLAFVCTPAWTPLVLVSLHQAVAAPALRRRVGWLVVGGLLFGVQILAGFTQMAMYAVPIYTAYVAFHASFQLRDAKLPFGSAIRRLTGWGGGVALFGAVGALLAAALVLPASELMAHSARSAENFQAYTWEPTAFGKSLGRLMLQAIAQNTQEPGLLGAKRAVAVLIPWILSLNVGLLMLTASALLSQRRRSVATYGVMLYLLLDLTLGRPMPLASILDLIAPTEASFSGYGAILLGIPMALLAGFGVEAVADRAEAGGLSRGAVAYLLLVGILLLCVASDPPFVITSPIFPWILLPLSVLGVLVASAQLPQWSRRALIGVLMVETIVCAPVMVEYASLTRGFGYAGTAEELDRPPLDEVRQARALQSSTTNQHLWSLASAMGGYEPLVLNWSLPLLANPGYETMYTRAANMDRNTAAVSLLKRRFWLAPRYVAGHLPDKSRLFPPTEAVFTPDGAATGLPEVTVEDLPRSAIGIRGEEQVLWGLDSRRQRRAVAAFSDVRIPAESSSLFIDYTTQRDAKMDVAVRGEGDRESFAFIDLPLLATGSRPSTVEIPIPDFPRATLTVRIKGAPANLERIALVSDASDERARIHVRTLTPDHVELDLQDLPGPRALVFMDAAYPGWSATLDGEPVPILLANDAFKAVAVPAGSHRVTFEFRPPRVYAGVGISIATLAIGSMAIAWCFGVSGRGRSTV